MSTEESLLNRLWAAAETFPPTSYLMYGGQMYINFLLDRAVMALIAFLSGAGCLLLLQAFILWRIYKSSPPCPPPDIPTAGSVDVRLPQVLKSRLGEDIRSKKEDGTWFNFFLQFMFSELQDSLQLRRFLTKKIQTEFEEILRSRSGILVDELFLRDFNLGDNFPVFMGISVDKSEVVRDVIQTLDIRGRVMYDGGFQIAIDAALPFGRVAFVSVQVLKVRGLLRFRFTRHPFSHWCMSFYEEPEIELDISAQLDGRPMPRLKGIFASQIRRLIRKKHTLPMYKMRFKPFFPPRPDIDKSLGQRIKVDGTDVGHGIFEVTVKGASRLRFIPKGAYFYCTVSVDELPWKQKVAEERKKREIITVQLVKNSADQSLGMTVKDELFPDRLHPVVVIEGIIVGMPAHMAQLKNGEILVAVSGNKVYSAKEASKSLKWTKENKIEIQIERRESHQEEISKDDLPLNKKTSEDLDSASPMRTRSLPPSSQNSQTNLKVTSSLNNNSRKTISKPACENPSWDQKFIFTVDPSLHFLNVCLWSKGGDYSGSTEVLKSAKHDVLVGYASLSLEDIYLHCLITLNGSLCDRIKLKHGHYKTEAELIKEWSAHKGWDPTQMYGDLSLALHFHPTHLSPQQRQKLASCRSSSSHLLNDEGDGGVTQSASAGLGSEQAGRKPGERPDNGSMVEVGRDVHEGHHQFDSTTFITATFCDYCGRKIWMKEAFKCRTCSMVCHKKCLAKCLVNTVCTTSGARKRDAEDEAWKPLQTAARPAANSLRADVDQGKQSTAKSQDIEEELDQDKIEEQVSSLLSEVSSLSGQQEMSGQTRLRADSSSETSQHGRFRVLKDQTDRMKENVLRHLKRNKTPSASNDKAILAAKQAGGQLFADMDPLLRKDKLEEMVRRLDEQLVLEMQHKESLEGQQEQLESLGQGNGTAEFKAIQYRITKSGEKVEAMRLLMLQYCAGLQSCINYLETETEGADGVDSRSASPNAGVSQFSDTDSPRPERKRNTFVGMSQGVGGFVRRASSSVKEKMSSFKEFGRKGAGAGSKTSSPSKGGLNVDDSCVDEFTERNNSGLGSLMEVGGECGIGRNSRSKSDGQVEHLRITESGRPVLVDKVALSPERKDIVRDRDVTSTRLMNQPAVEIHVDRVESPVDELPPRAVGERRHTSPTNILRSRSDSQLDIKLGNTSNSASSNPHDSKGEAKSRQSLSPGDILSYGGSSTSLPPQLFHDSDSDCSDYVLIESSDDDNIVRRRRGVSVSCSSSDYDDDDDDDVDFDDHNDVAEGIADVTFEGDPLRAVGEVVTEVEEKDGEEHRTILQQLHTYQSIP